LKQHKATILVVDDEKDIGDLLSDVLTEADFKVTTAVDSTSAFSAIENFYPSLIILDIWLKNSKLDGIGILEQIQQKCPFVPVIIISGHATKQIAKRAIEIGAFDYIEKPFQEDRILFEVEKALKFRQINIQNDYLVKRYKQKFFWFEQNYEKVIEFKKKNEKYFSENHNLILNGNPETYELKDFAYYIHTQNNNTARFTSLNTNTVNKDKHALYLFGKKMGSDFSPNFGALDFSNFGTVYIEEVHGLEKQVQKQLASFLGLNKFVRLNADNKITSNVRFIVSSEKKLTETDINKDFLTKLNAKEIKIPNPLTLVPSFKELFLDINLSVAKSLNTSIFSFTDKVIDNIGETKWLGIRQIFNFTESLYLFINDTKKEGKITNETINDFLNKNSTKEKKEDFNLEKYLSLDLKNARESFEVAYIKEILQRNGNNISKTAKIIDMERSALHRKIKTLGID
jgi:two-component system nitrogen regulation response regulator NtrX